MVITAFVLSIVSTLTAVWSIWYARQSARSAQLSAGAAETTAELDSDRRHAELTPQLRVTCEPLNPGSTTLRLQVFLVGPPELQRLDGLTAVIRDDHPWRAHIGAPTAGATPEQIAEQIWGPYMFTPGVGPGADPVRGIPGADRTGRTTPTGGMPVGEVLPFQLEPTRPPTWFAQSPDDWKRERGPVVRLTMECSRDGMEPWTLKCEINTERQSVVTVP